LTDNEEDQSLASNGAVATDKDFSALVADAKDFAGKCAKAAGSNLGHYSTMDAAKDMELLRVLLGNQKLNYLGKSYGTYLGTLYAYLYPKNIAHMVLDGAVDPQVPINQQNLSQAIAFDQALKDFQKKYPTITTKEITTLIQSAHMHPLKINGRTLTDALLVTGMADALYDNVTGWPALNEAFTKAERADGSALLALADDYNQRDPSGHYLNNQNDISTIVNCLDWSDNRPLDQIRSDATIFNQQAPIFGPYIAFAGLTCHFWKAPSANPKLPATISISTPIIIIGVTRDPATPYDWALGLHKLLPNSTLLTFQGEGHTGLGRGDSALDKEVDQYLLVKSTP
jgi:pimeloyl-ACP methyl ester carboxylesterase